MNSLARECPERKQFFAFHNFLIIAFLNVLPDRNAVAKQSNISNHEN